MFQKGVVTNPNGRPAQSEQEKEFKRLAPRELAIISKDMLFNKTVKEVKEMSLDPTLPHIYGLMAKYLYSSYQNADPKNLEWLFTRIIGKPREYDPVDDADPIANDPVKLNALRNLVKIGLGIMDGNSIPSDTGSSDGIHDNRGYLGNHESQVGSTHQAGVEIGNGSTELP